jgi:hypothetical protein
MTRRRSLMAYDEGNEPEPDDEDEQVEQIELEGGPIRPGDVTVETIIVGDH